MVLGFESYIFMGPQSGRQDREIIKGNFLSKLSRQVGDALAQAQVGGITGGAVDGVGETVVWAEVEMEV